MDVNRRKRDLGLFQEPFDWSDGRTGWVTIEHNVVGHVSLLSFLYCFYYDSCRSSSSPAAEAAGDPLRSRPTPAQPGRGGGLRAAEPGASAPRCA
jgi:hypothetical protein